MQFYKLHLIAIWVASFLDIVWVYYLLVCKLLFLVFELLKVDHYQIHNLENVQENDLGLLKKNLKNSQVKPSLPGLLLFFISFKAS